ncbi:MAG TPA: PilZ domain-containing protein, partial [Polyangiaceae bacterium]|nr:PilZ domain-containing protein [Polyangiaceae bacterium]
MTEPRSLLLVGKLRPEKKRSLNGMAIAAELPLVAIEESTDALAWLESNDPGCVIVDAGIGRLDKVIGRVRSKRELAHVPIFALVTTPDDLWIEQYFTWGGDDVVPMEAGATLLERLRAVPREVPKPVANRRAIVAEPDRTRSEVFSRVFNLAGFDVRAAADVRALDGAIKEFEPTVVIANSAMGELPNVISQTRKGRATPTWAVLAARREFESQQAAFANLPGVFVIGVQTNPWQLLSRANEIGRTTGPERRREPRRPFGSFVLFRAAGSDEDEVGIAYNLSSRGMFVRSYAPVQSEEVWLEWRVPQDKTRVRLAGKVVWRQASLTDGARAASPLGFGIEFCDYLGGARKHLEQALEALDSAAKRVTAAGGGGTGVPSSARKSLSGPASTGGGAESRRPVSLEPDAWELEVTGESARPAPATAPLTAATEPKIQPKLQPKPPLEPGSTSSVGAKSEGSSTESELKRPPPAPPPSVKASGRQVPRPNAPPRPVPAAASATGSAGAVATAGLGDVGSPIGGDAPARETSDAASGPRTPRGGMLAPAAPRIASLPRPAGAPFGTSTMVGLGAPPSAWLPTDRQASAALKSADADARRADGSDARREAIVERPGSSSAEDGPSSSDTTEILNNPTALFEIAADSIPPMQDAIDDAPTVVTAQILDSSAAAADAVAAAAPAADATPVFTSPVPELRGSESRFGADELETRRWSGSVTPGQIAEPDPVSSAPFYVSERAKSGAGRGKVAIGAGVLVLAGVAAIAYWLSSSKAPKANTQVAAPSAVVVPQSGAPSAVPVSSAVSSGGAATI